ncbi:Methicillin resistance regulatory protein MecI [Pedobacter sp. Bi27]|nr:Methicillin resistance regulatory protein MecI [Pedobacter sp. Bi36]CAH0192679.1 Methicillin resistance regulatory protein MecI [Pedobacter sp. Bi27]CAH0224525.1 Methicillin resistance regulatory protein MecI [Pedobacter sp. Bi126]
MLSSLLLLTIMEIKDLTKAEEQIMQVLWQLEKAFVKEVIDELPLPKPAYNTVSTIIRILETKGFIGHEAFGKAHQYYPLISREEYKRHATEKLLGNYFENSVESMFSFFVKEEKLDLSDVDEILKMINKIKHKPK